ncbi:hypothetical protein MMC07_002205 [Pseudocyphellaria aurata]|nr:hypothetical protein [Pseudocyphellaria aurata]
MQEWVRTSFGDYLDSLEEGTSIPIGLTLIHERDARFSLQPSRSISITELNDLLSEFYHQSATFTDAEEWMNRNEYHDSTADEDIEKWRRQ